MIPKKKYVLGDFTKYGTSKLARQFAAIADLDLYDFTEKMYLDEKNEARQCHMLLVGHFSFKSGGPPVWAEATGQRICYYSGTGFLVTPLIHNVQSSKVYYDPPFSRIGGALDYSNVRPGMSPERKLERAVVEATINFIFLQSGRLEQVQDLMNPDILSNFRQACRNFSLHQKPPSSTDSTFYEPILGNGASTPSSSRRLYSIVPPPPAEQNGQLAVRNKDMGPPVLRKRHFADLEDGSSDDLLRDSNKRTRLHDRDNHRDAKIHAKIEREVRDLRAQLVDQEAKTSATKERLLRERTKRREAQVQREAWKEKFTKAQEQVDEASKPEEDERERPDWESMLIEQEKQTEHYKLKYVALKEETVKWETDKATRAANKLILKGQIRSLRSQLSDQRNTLRNYDTAATKHQDERERLQQELAKEKDARIFWQRKHNRQPANSQGRPLPPGTPLEPRTLDHGMQVVRAPLDNRRAQARQRTSGLELYYCHGEGADELELMGLEVFEMLLNTPKSKDGTCANDDTRSGNDCRST